MVEQAFLSGRRADAYYPVSLWNRGMVPCIQDRQCSFPNARSGACSMSRAGFLVCCLLAQCPGLVGAFCRAFLLVFSRRYYLLYSAEPVESV
jgi:hypothetical protein